MLKTEPWTPLTTRPWWLWVVQFGTRELIWPGRSLPRLRDPSGKRSPRCGFCLSACRWPHCRALGHRRRPDYASATRRTAHMTESYKQASRARPSSCSKHAIVQLAGQLEYSGSSPATVLAAATAPRRPACHSRRPHNVGASGGAALAVMLIARFDGDVDQLRRAFMTERMR
jgi:hypothetical protein